MPEFEDVKPLCKQLTQKLKQRYEELRSSGSLMVNQYNRPNEVSDIFIQFIKTGQPFSDAEQFLKKCGFAVGERKVPPAPANRPDYDSVIARSNSIIKLGFGTGAKVLVSITPDQPFIYEKVSRIEAFISVTAI